MTALEIRTKFSFKKKNMTPQCALEIVELQDEARKLLKRGTPHDIAKAVEIRKRYEAIEKRGFSSDEMRAKYAQAVVQETAAERRTPNDAEYRSRYDGYLGGKVAEDELRDFMSGQLAITYTQGPAGGFTIPFAYDGTVREANSQTDKVLDPGVTDFSMTNGPFLQPQQVSGFNLATVAGQLVTEAAQQAAQAIPTVAGATLKNNLTFRATFGASLEGETDIPDFGNKIVRAASVALARIIAQKVLIGRGGASDVNGITNQLSSSYTNTTSGKITLTDLNAVYFGVDRWYRSAPKCAWLVSDGTYKLLRAATDGSGRPLLDVVDDREMLLGKPVFNCPSLGATYLSLGLTGALLFGDLSHIVIRASRPTIQRTTQQGINDITKGECLYIARCRADAVLFDPSNGAYPPVVLATIN